MAEEAGLHVATKKDSTGICFIGERPFKDFLTRYLPPKKGEIRRLDDGKVMGEHDGLMYHTLGQRKGLHIGGIKEKGARAVAITMPGSWLARIWTRTCFMSSRGMITRPCSRASWSPSNSVGCPARRRTPHWVYSAKPRYRTSDQPCEVEWVDAESCEIRFAEPQWALTPGQSVVLYESRVCLGGGVIR